MTNAKRIIIPDQSHAASNSVIDNYVSLELLKYRRIFLTEEINEKSACTLLQSLIYLDEISDEPIELYINSEGGEVSSGMAVYHYITQKMRSRVDTYCIGTVASMAALIYLAGAERYIFNGTKIIVHSPTSVSGTFEKPDQLKGRLDSLEKTRKMICSIITERTGLNFDKVYEFTGKDTVFTAKDAIKYGLATKMIRKENTNNKFSSNPDNNDINVGTPYSNESDKSGTNPDEKASPDTVMLTGVPNSLVRLERRGMMPIYRFGFAYKFDEDDYSVVYANVEIKVSAIRFAGSKYNINLGNPDTQYSCSLSDGSDPVILTAKEIADLYKENKLKYFSNKIRKRDLKPQ